MLIGSGEVFIGCNGAADTTRTMLGFVPLPDTLRFALCSRSCSRHLLAFKHIPLN